MTSEEIGRLTISEVEAIVARATDALAKFREAQAMLGGPVTPTLQAQFMTTQPIAIASTPLRPAGAPNPLLTASENAERARLIKLNTMGPDDLAAMEAP
jgi:hypothetical protein